LRFFFANFGRSSLILNINGKERETKSSQNLEELVEELEINAPHFAIALNYQVIPKSQYNSTAIKDGDKIEIVHAVGGGI
jgi:sulfur carrier protein